MQVFRGYLLQGVSWGKFSLFLAVAPDCGVFVGFSSILYIQAGFGRQRMACSHHPQITPSIGMYRSRMLTVRSEERHV
jgi:hypothetical protein